MRQKVRNGILLISLILFPLTLNFFSPVKSLYGAHTGVISGSLALFGLLFLSSLFLGRAFCGWVCMGGCLQDICMKVNNRRRPRHHWIKFLIWVPWFSLLVFFAVRAGGFRAPDFAEMATDALALTDPQHFPIYFTVTGLIIGIALASGRHGFCHYACWMAPFMMIGRKTRNAFNWPSLGLEASPEKCIACGTCTSNCPMSINVQERVKKNDLEDADCVLCGQCADNCKQHVISYTFSRRKKPGSAEAKSGSNKKFE